MPDIRDISTIYTYLMYSKDDEAWQKLADIRTFPEIGGEPNRIETTTMSDEIQTFIAGIKQAPSANNFDASFNKEMWKEINGLKGQPLYFGLWFSNGKVSDPSQTSDDYYIKFKGHGTVTVSLKSGSVDSRVEASVAITLDQAFVPEE